jgi:hypothetical protein
VKALGVDPRDEIDMDTSKGANIREHPARDGGRELVLTVLESDKLHTLVGKQIAEEKVDFENGATVHPSGGRTERVRSPNGNLGVAPVTFVAKLALYRLEPSQKLRCHHLIDVFGARPEIARCGSEKGSQDVRVVGEVRTEVGRTRFRSPQKLCELPKRLTLRAHRHAGGGSNRAGRRPAARSW